jgi:uncharacterized protein YfaS (alpha-2-macroglobulin family)
MRKILPLFFLLFLGSAFFTGCSDEKALSREAQESYKILASDDQTWGGEDLFALSVNYFSGGDSAGEVYDIPEEDGPMLVVDGGPLGALPQENSRPVIYGAFNHPVVPLSALGSVINNYEFMEISPPVKGVYRWYGSRLISFEPDETLLTEQEYLVTFKAGLSSLGGKELKNDFSFAFQTEALEVVTFYPGTPLEPWLGDFEGVVKEVPPEQAKHLTVSFNHKVDKEILVPQLRVVSSLGEHSFKADYPHDPDNKLPAVFKERTLVLILDQEPSAQDQLSVVIPPGTHSREGSLGTREEQQVSLSTLSAFRFIEYDDYNWRFPREGDADVRPVYIEFSHPLDPESFLDYLEISLDGVNPEEHVTVWDKYMRINALPVEYDSTYQITLKKGLKDIYGRVLDRDSVLDIEVGPASSYYYLPYGGFRFLEAAFPPRVIFEYQNLKGGFWQAESTTDPYKKLPESRLTTPFDLSGQVKNRLEYEMLDLSPYLNEEGKGAVAMSWKLETEDNRWGPYKNDLVLQVTDLGITMRYGYNRVLVWVNSLSSGEPVSGAAVNLLNDTRTIISGQTDDQGLASFTLEEGEFLASFYDSKGSSHIRAEVVNGADRAVFKPNSSHSPYPFGLWSRSSINRVEKPYPFTFLFSDRGLYKPGEKLTFKGIDRDLVLGRWVPYRGGYSLTIRENTWRSETVQNVSGVNSERGSFHGTIEVDEDLPTGSYLMEYTRTSGENSDRVIKSVPFMIENFRRAGFQVRVDKPLKEALPGEKVTFPVSASYLSGGSLAGAPYQARWTREPVRFNPGNRDYEDYSFGPLDWENSSFLGSTGGNLDSAGQTQLTEKIAPANESGHTYTYRVEVTVEDPSRQEIAGRGFTIIHPAPFYIGARVKNSTDSWWTRFVAAGETSTADLALVTPEGVPFIGEDLDVTVRLLRREWKVARQRGISGRISNNWEEEIIQVSEESLRVKKDRFTWEFTPDKAGYYTLAVSAKDKQGRTALTEMSLYASGSQWVKWQNRNPENIEMVTDRDLYRPGETARIMVQSPLERGSYLLTIEREGILEERILELEGSASVIDIPIKEEWCPVMYVSLSSFTARTAEPPSTYGEPDMGKPRGCYGLVTLPVSTDSRLLNVELAFDKTLYAPGEEGSCEISVTANGKPLAGSEVTLLAVDRGVLDLIGYHVPDPVAFFYDRDNYIYGVHGGDSRADLIDPVTYELKDLQGGDGDNKLNRRRDFSPLAVFMPSLITNEKGKVTADFTFPDTLTTYRFTALAMEGDRFGRKEKEVPVQNPLTVRTGIPPLLRVRDTAFCGIFVTNLTDKPVDMTSEVEIDESLVTVNGKNKTEFTVKPGETREIRYPLQALGAGEVTASFTVRSSVLSEVLEQTFTVEKPLVDESFTIVGEVEAAEEDTAAGEGLVIPSNIARGYGSLSLSLAATRFANITGALEFFHNYPYNLTLDNKLMAMIPSLVLGETLNELLPDQYDSERSGRFFSQASAYQDREGGMAFSVSPWSKPSVWLSIRVLHFLSYAHNRGEDVSPIDLASLTEYVRKSCYDKNVSLSLKLYGHYVLSLIEGPEKGNRSVIYLVEKERDNLGFDGFLLAALSLDRSDSQGEETFQWLSERINNLVKVGTQTLDITDTYENRTYFDSQIQDLSLLFLFYTQAEKKPHLARMAAATLATRQENGRWERLNDTLWAFTALAQEIERAEETRMTAAVTAGELSLLKADYGGGDFAVDLWTGSLFEAPLDSLPRDTMIPLTVTAKGAGTAYYRASLNYALPLEVINARDEGFSIFTEILDLNDRVVKPDKLKLGETYRMRAVLSSSKRRNMVALKIPVPSGAEILNASFVTTGDYEGEGGVDGENWTREEFYGEESTTIAEGYGFFAGDGFYFDAFPQEKRIGLNSVTYGFSDFYAGKREVSFLFRPYCPGVYPVPPAKAECLYEGEVFGRSSGMLYVIE